MRKIIIVELLKLNNKTNIIFLILSILMYARDYFFLKINSELEGVILTSNYVYPTFTYTTISSINLLTLWIVQNISFEFQNKITQRSIANGFSKLDYFLSKIFFILLTSLFFSVMYIITIFLFIKNNGIEIQSYYIVERALTIFIYSFSLGMLGFLFAQIFRHSLSASVCYYIYFFVDILLAQYYSFFKILPINSFRCIINNDPKFVSYFFDLTTQNILIYIFWFTLILITNYIIFLKRDFAPL